MIGGVTEPVRLGHGSTGRTEGGKGEAVRNPRRNLDARLAPETALLVAWEAHWLGFWVLIGKEVQGMREDVPGAPGEELWE